MESSTKTRKVSLRPIAPREVALTPVQKKALMRARKNLKEGNTLTLDELKRRLGFRSR